MFATIRRMTGEIEGLKTKVSEGELRIDGFENKAAEDDTKFAEEIACLKSKAAEDHHEMHALVILCSKMKSALDGKRDK